MVNERTKRLAETVFVLAVCTALFTRACVPPPARQVIHGFELNRDSFVTVAEYIESFDWEAYTATPDGRSSASFGFWVYYGEVMASSSKGDIPVPEQSEDVKAAVRLLISKLHYIRIARTTASGNTIFFMIKTPPLNFDYYNQGVCYVIDGGEPTPTSNYDYFTEYVQPLGNNWYYWNGHCYYG